MRNVITRLQQPGVEREDGGDLRQPAVALALQMARGLSVNVARTVHDRGWHRFRTESKRQSAAVARSCVADCGYSCVQLHCGGGAAAEVATAAACVA